MRPRLALLTALACSFICACTSSDEGIEIPSSEGVLYLKPLADGAVRVRFRTETQTLPLEELIYTEKVKAPKWHKEETPEFITLELKDLKVVYDKSSGALSFWNRDGKKILEEKAGGRRAELTSIDGVQMLDVQQSFVSPEGEFLYGTGQFQDGYLNVRGLTRRLTQVNSQISIPFVLSSEGYGLLWNNYGLTDFNPSTSSVALEEVDTKASAQEVNTTSTTGNLKERRVSNVFRAEINLDRAGEYSFLLDVGQTMARKHYLAIDGQVVFDYNNLWLPPTCSARIELAEGPHIVEVQGVRGDAPRVGWKFCGEETVLHSPLAEALDYTVFAGSADEVVASYRHLTGEVPQMPDYMLGYVHCRERYNTQEELLSTAEEFQKRQIPLDVIVQDWQYWGKYGWNAMRFDEDRYPDPAEMISRLHAEDVRFMLSVWSKVAGESELGHEIDSLGYYIKGTEWIDYFKPEAAAFYWNSLRNRLLKPYDIDIWWFDATEPENDDLVGRRIGDGQIPAEVYRNVYPVKVIDTMYKGLLAEDEGRLPAILTRCGFSGMQRYGALMWSGDVGNDMSSLKRQIVGGLGFVSTGLPWWTYDAGGFFRPFDQYTDPVYQQRMLRWIQTSVFLPVMRVHGYMSHTEPWNYSPQTEERYVSCIKEREALLPYVKECARRVSEEGYTLMRPLVFDFATDPEALRQETEYMFGPKYLVCPITEDGVTGYRVYLPINQAGWTDHYTGQHYAGGSYVELPTSPDHIFVFERN